MLAFVLAFMLAFVLAFMPAFMPALMLAFVPAFVLAFMLAFVLAFLLAFVGAFMLAFVLAFMLAVMLASGVGVEAPLEIWFFAWPLAKILAIAPVSLGGIGVREASLAALMAPFGADAAGVVAAPATKDRLRWWSRKRRRRWRRRAVSSQLRVPGRRELTQVLTNRHTSTTISTCFN